MFVHRLLEELKKGQWLPQVETRTYTLLQFQNALLKRNKESRGVLEEFLHFRSLILAMVISLFPLIILELIHTLMDWHILFLNENKCTSSTDFYTIIFSLFIC